MCCVLMLATVMPLQAIAQSSTDKADFVSDEVRLAQMQADAGAVDDVVVAEESILIEKSFTPEQIVDRLIAVAEAQSTVTSVWRDDADTFEYTLSNGMTCLYDYEIRHGQTEQITIDPLNIDETLGADAQQDRSVSSTNINVAVFAPYYGIEEDTFFDFCFVTVGPAYASYTGGTMTSFVGMECDVVAIKQIGNYGTVIVDSHGAYSDTNNISYISIYNTNGIAASDYTNGYAVNLVGGGVGVNYLFFRHYLTATLPNSFIYLGICSGAEDGKLTAEFISKGAGIVYGYDAVTTNVYNAYTVTFQDSLTGDIIMTMQVEHGTYLDEADFPTPPTHLNYVFVRWLYNSGPITMDSYVRTLYRSTIGDVNMDGEFTMADVLLIMRYSMSVGELSEEQLIRADYNSDGHVNISDALALMREILGVNPPLPPDKGTDAAIIAKHKTE